MREHCLSTWACWILCDGVGVEWKVCYQGSTVRESGLWRLEVGEVALGEGKGERKEKREKREKRRGEKEVQ